MSFHDYQKSLILSESDPSFEALLMAAMRKADSDNIIRLKTIWPETYEEFMNRYYSPNGLLPGEKRTR